MLDLATLIHMMIHGVRLERLERPGSGKTWLATALDDTGEVIASCHHEPPEGALDYILGVLAKRGK